MEYNTFIDDNDEINDEMQQQYLNTDGRLEECCKLIKCQESSENITL